MGLIYKRISPSGKYYIGKTVGLEKDRWKNHVKEALDERSDTYNTILCKAIRKYGGQNFTVEILEDNIPDDLLSEKEKYYIEKYQSFYFEYPNIGYNLTRGGDGATLYSDEQIFSLWEEGMGINQICKIIGCTRSTVRKRLASKGISIEERKNRGAEINSKTQTLFDKYKDIILELYNKGYQQTDIISYTGLSEPTVRKYLSMLNITDIKERDVLRRTKPVYQLDLNGNIIRLFNSAKEAAQVINPQNSISAKRGINDEENPKNKTKTSYGFKWKYLEDYNKEISK